LGIPLAKVQWRLTDLTRHSIQKYALMLKDQYRLIGAGELELEPWIFDPSPEAWNSHVTDQFHHIGATRMHDSPRQGVVDRDCRVHGIANLYIGSSSVFPTSGHSNPTLTIIALCMRLADRFRVI